MLGIVRRHQAGAKPNRAGIGGGRSTLSGVAARARALSVLGLPPWLRAPLLLYREVGAFSAMMVAAIIVSVASSSAPLFLGTIGAAALERTIAAGCPEAAGVSVDDPSVQFLKSGFGSYGDNSSEIMQEGRQVQAAMGDAGLPMSDRVLIAQFPSSLPVEFTLFSRPGALQHIELLSGARSGRGVWLPQPYSAQENLGVGDTISFDGVAVPVAGIYSSLGGNGFEDILPEYWCTWRDLLVPGLESRPPTFVLVDEATILAIEGTISATWHASLRPEELTLAGVRDVLDRVDALKEGLADRGLIPPEVLNFESLPYEVRTDLERYLERSEGLSAGVRGPVTPVAVMATLIALCFVSAAGAFWVERRRREVQLLVSRGVGPLALAVKAGLEVGPAVVAGSALGWAGTIALVRVLGPSQRFEPGAVLRSAVVVALTMLAALLLLGVTAAARVTTFADVRGRMWRGLSRVPWELALVAAAIVFLLRPASNSVASAGRSVGQVNTSDIALPLLILTGATFLMVRMLVELFPLVRRRAGRSRPSLFLAVRRASAAGMVVTGLALFTAQPVGVYVYASAITDITQSNLQDKSATYAGAENVISVAITPGSLPDVDGDGTVVSVITGAHFNGEEIQILGVQPDSFADFATDVTDGALPGLMDGLQHTADGAILVAAKPLDEPPATVEIHGQELDIEIVDTVSVFPGMRSLYQAVLVVDRARLVDLDRYTPRQDEVWTTDTGLAAGLDRLDDLGIRVERIRNPDTLLDVTDLLTVSWAFGYMRALAVLSGLIGASGLLLYLNLRSRKAASAYILARRMGLRRQQHLASLMAELLGVLVASWVIGAVACLIALWVAGGRLDVDPVFPPPPETALPLLALGATGGIVLMLVVIGALVAQRVADHTEPARVLRMDG